MKDPTIAIALALLLVVGVVAISLRPTDQQHDSFHVSITQNGTAVEAQNGVVSLRKAPFQFVLTMQKPMSLIVLASHNKTWFTQAEQGVALEAMINPGLGYADTLFNSGRNLYLSDSGLNYWFYSEPADHRFDEVAFHDTSVIGVRTVEKLYYPEKNQEIEVKNCPDNEIYLVFAYAEYNNQTRKYTEYQRETLRIKFK